MDPDPTFHLHRAIDAGSVCLGQRQEWDTLPGCAMCKPRSKEEKIEGGLEKAMLGYQRFLEDTPDSALTPEAIRRLADLKIQKEYGTLTTGPGPPGGAGIAPPEPATRRRWRRSPAHRRAGIGAYSGPRRVQADFEKPGNHEAAGGQYGGCCRHACRGR